MMGDGIFGSMFDFNRDGTLDALERAVEFQLINELSMRRDSDDAGADCDNVSHYDYDLK